MGFGGLPILGGGGGGGLLGNSPIGGISGTIGGMTGINLEDTPFLGSLFGDSKGQAAQQAMKRVADEYAKYRPTQMQNYETLKGNARAQYVPAANMLHAMYGMELPNQPRARPINMPELVPATRVDAGQYQDKFFATPPSPDYVPTGGSGGSAYNYQPAIKAAPGHFNVAPNGTLDYIPQGPSQQQGYGWNGRTDVTEGQIKRTPEEERKALGRF